MKRKNISKRRFLEKTIGLSPVFLKDDKFFDKKQAIKMRSQNLFELSFGAELNLLKIEGKFAFVQTKEGFKFKCLLRNISSTPFEVTKKLAQ